MSTASTLTALYSDAISAASSLGSTCFKLAGANRTTAGLFGAALGRVYSVYSDSDNWAMAESKLNSDPQVNYMLAGSLISAACGLASIPGMPLSDWLHGEDAKPTYRLKKEWATRDATADAPSETVGASNADGQDAAVVGIVPLEQRSDEAR